jgi:hypothetical protein
MEERYSDGVTPSCPRCGRRGVPLVFGLPGPAACAAARDGQVLLGGCRASSEPLNWQCSRRHRWHDADEPPWQARLLEILASHGYSDGTNWE